MTNEAAITKIITDLNAALVTFDADNAAKAREWAKARVAAVRAFIDEHKFDRPAIDDRLLINKWTIMDRITTLSKMARMFAVDSYTDVDHDLFLKLEQAIQQAMNDFTTEVQIRSREYGL